MTIRTDIRVELDADQVDTYIWEEMDAYQQTELLKWMGRRHALSTHEVERQMCAVKEAFDDFDKNARDRTIKFLESLLGWLKGAEE